MMYLLVNKNNDIFFYNAPIIMIFYPLKLCFHNRVHYKLKYYFFKPSVLLNIAEAKPNVPRKKEATTVCSCFVLTIWLITF